MKKIIIPLLALIHFANAAPLNLVPITDNIQWDNIPIHEKVLFYPSKKTTYTWLNSEEHEGFSKANFATKLCSDCHQNEEKGMGNLYVQKDFDKLGYKKNGFVNTTFQFANDANYLYIKAMWKTQADSPGRMHDMVQFDGENWKRVGGDRFSNHATPMYEDRFSIMIDDGKVAQYKQQGCFMTCHEGEVGMSHEASKEDVKKLSIIGDSGLKQTEIKKFLPQSRSENPPVWDKLKTQLEIDQLKAAGQFVDLMQWRSARSAAIGAADDGYVFEYRLGDAGKNIFSWNIDRKNNNEPKYMFDFDKTGFYALNDADAKDLNKPTSLIEGFNTMDYDASKIQKDQYLPGRFLQTASGSAADNNEVASSWDDGIYTVIFKRKLNTGNPQDDKIMHEGGVYDISIAIHDDKTTSRSHFVSFPFILGIGDTAKGDINSTPVK